MQCLAKGKLTFLGNVSGTKFLDFQGEVAQAVGTPWSPTFLWGQHRHSVGTCLGVPGGQHRWDVSLQGLFGIPEAKASLSPSPDGKTQP